MNREERIKELISRMTLEEKVSQLSYISPAIERLGIPAYNWWNECLHGVARAGPATVFPQAIALAATFDEALVRSVAEAISDEGRAKYNEASKRGNRGQYYGLTFWTPNINIFRDPRWGRGQETYGEDPYLTSRMGLAFMKGLQGEEKDRLKTAACAKHFAVHSGPEKLRHTFDAVVSQKDLYETYLPAFKVLVENGVEAVMGAYNRTLGEPCCGSNLLLKDILRGKWAFKGHVVSDCWAIKDFHENHKITRSPEESAAMALNAGCDLNCGCTYPMLTVACKKGLVTEEAINQALGRLLTTRFKLGLFDPPEEDPYAKLGGDMVCSEEHRALSLEAARSSIVLLKNDILPDGKRLLPLDDSAKRILLIGPAAANIQTLLANYHGLSSHLVTILEGLTAKIKDKHAIGFEYRQGSLMYEDIRVGFQPSGASSYDDAPLPGLDNTDVVIACYGLDNAIEGEEGDAIASDSNGDRDSIELPPWQLHFLRRIRKAGKKVILVLTGGSPIAFSEDIADAVLFVWYSGEEGGTAVADVIFGDVNPSGKLPITFPQSTAQLPPYEDYSMKGRTYRYMEETPLYPFGFGLSYTTVRFDSIELSEKEISAGGAVKAVVTMTNTGDRDVREVLQIYVSKDKRSGSDPAASLRSFSRVSLPAGKTVKAEVELPAGAFESVNGSGETVLSPGVYTVTAANAAPLPVALVKGAATPVSAKIAVK